MTLRTHQADFDRAVSGILSGSGVRVWLGENYHVPESKGPGVVMEGVGR
jgi:hypothetical protein